MQMKEEQLRIEEDEAETKKRHKADRDHHKNWEASRDNRVGTWRTFAQGNKSKKVQSTLRSSLSKVQCNVVNLH